MATKDLHEKPFDETTLLKLKLFEDYAQAWLPTFIINGYYPEIHVFDFFAGTGYDLNGEPGSPIRFINKIIEQRGHIFNKQVKVYLHLNEFDSSKYSLLEESVNQKLIENKGIESRVKVILYNEDFVKLFPKVYHLIKKYPSLVYMDQNGVKFLSDEYRYQLEISSKTDFIFFAASSYIRRFGEEDEFVNHFSFNLSPLKSVKYDYLHRSFTEMLKGVAKNEKIMYLPFTLKKNKNIYGVIFGATHTRAFDKFLNVTWKYGGASGDANFDIDDEANIGQLDIFNGQRLTKIEAFQQMVREKVLNESITNNVELLNFTYENGHLPKHSDEVLRKLKEDKLIMYNANTPCVTYNSVFKEKRIIKYEKVKN